MNPLPEHFPSIGASFLKALLEASWQASVVVVLILALRPLLGNRVSARWRYALWSLVLLRLLVPAFVMPPSPASLQNLAVVDRPYEQIQRVLKQEPITAPAVDETPKQSEETLTAQNATHVSDADPTPALQPDASRPDTVAQAPVAAAKPDSTSSRLWKIAPLVWLSGTVLLAFWILIPTLLLDRRLKRDRFPVSEWIQKIWAECCVQVGVAQPLPVIATGSVQSPALLGIVRPMLLIPKSAIDGFSPEDWRHVFMHELAHLKRRDHWTQILQLIALCAHWFNPLVWVGFRYLRADRELAADEWALRRLNETDAAAYGKTLLKVLIVQAPRFMPPCLVGIMEDASQLKQRLRHIVAFGPRKILSSLLGFSVLLVLVAAVVGRAPDPFIPGVSDQLEMKGYDIDAAVASSFNIAKSRRIDGIVVSADGAPVANATVTMAQMKVRPLAVDGGVTKTKSDGTFHFEPGLMVCDQAMIELLVEAEGFGVGAIRTLPVEGEEKLRVTLEKPIEASIILVNEAGEPQPNVRIAPAWLYGKGSYVFPPKVAARFAQISDSKGVCRFPKFSPNTMIVFSSPEPFAAFADSERLRIGNESITKTLTLLPGGRIMGRVMNKVTGKSVAGVNVSAASFQALSSTAPQNFETSYGGAWSDQDGNFSITSLRPADYHLTVGLELSVDRSLQKDYTVAAQKGLSLKKGGTLENINFELIPGALIKGRVTAEELGAPLAGVSVMVYGPARPGAYVQSTHSDSEGNYQLRVPAGKQRLYPSRIPKGYAKAPDQEIEVEDGETALINFKLPPQAKVSGRVEDSTGKPLGDVQLSIVQFMKPGTQMKTQADGTFQHTDVAPYPVQIRFTKPGYASFLMHSEQPGVIERPIVMDQDTYFHGVVTGPDGVPLAGATVFAQRKYERISGPSTLQWFTEETKTGPDGQYRMQLQEGIYRIQVVDGGKSIARVMQTLNKHEATKLDLRLEPAVSFKAKVIDSQTGKGVSGLCLYVEDPETPPNAYVRSPETPMFQGISNADGELSIPCLKQGVTNFSVSTEYYPIDGYRYAADGTRLESAAKGYVKWTSEQCTEQWRKKSDPRGMEFDLQPNTGVVTIVIEKGVLIRGRVLDPSGALVEGADVRLIQDRRDTRFDEQAQEGTFEALFPASGPKGYHLVAKDNRGGRGDPRWANGSIHLITKPGDVIENIELRLKPPGTIKGRVLTSDGRPAAKHLVAAHPADRSGDWFKTDEDGRYTLTCVGPGKQSLQVSAGSPNYKYLLKWEEHTVDVPEGTTIEAPDVILP